MTGWSGDQLRRWADPSTSSPGDTLTAPIPPDERIKLPIFRGSFGCIPDVMLVFGNYQLDP